MEQHTLEITFEAEKVSELSDEKGTTALYRTPEDTYLVYIGMLRVAFRATLCLMTGTLDSDIPKASLGTTGPSCLRPRRPSRILVPLHGRSILWGVSAPFMRKIGIMETDSENTQVEKRKRGRPRKFDYTHLDEIAQQFGAKSRRGQQNHDCAMMAFHTLTMALEKEPEHKEWVQPMLDNVRPTVFAELGRCLEDEDPLVFWRGVLYLRDNPDVPAKKAMAAIRRIRLGESKPHESPVRLHQALIKTVNDHLARYPETRTKDILVALYMTEEAVEKMPAD
jgi:hypothetical protein